MKSLSAATGIRQIHKRPALRREVAAYLQSLIERFCLADDLSTHDPYDIWSTGFGLTIKRTYNRFPRLGLAPAALLALMDTLSDGHVRLYPRREYAIVRALAALSLLNVYRASSDRRFLSGAEEHLEWLARNSCSGFKGCGWGLGFPHAVTRDVEYDSNTPFATITPYVLEAFVDFSRESGLHSFDGIIRGILRFFLSDIVTMHEDAETLATSYGPFADRTVINAVAYTMYAHAALLPYAPGGLQAEMSQRIRKLYAYIRRHQRPDGSWLYSPHGRSFIDCFHSCIVLKNILKTNRVIDLPGASAIIAAGYAFVKQAFFDERRFLFRRFALTNKPGLIKFDLYDNAEVLNLAVLLDDFDLVAPLVDSVVAHFCRRSVVYSNIDLVGIRRRPNTLRWAVMPFLHAASALV